MVVKLAAPGSIRHQTAFLALSLPCAQIFLGRIARWLRLTDNLRCRLLSPAELTSGGGPGRGYLCRECVEQGDDGNRKRVGHSAGII
ncbi:Protein transport protein Sec61 subunit alpha isoform 1 [Manis javanica]|nr:Protein transport protein Sec61 subunit alpha isoform 1 [Manis javanica]